MWVRHLLYTSRNQVTFHTFRYLSKRMTTTAAEKPTLTDEERFKQIEADVQETVAPQKHFLLLWLYLNRNQTPMKADGWCQMKILEKVL